MDNKKTTTKKLVKKPTTSKATKVVKKPTTSKTKELKKQVVKEESVLEPSIKKESIKEIDTVKEEIKIDIKNEPKESLIKRIFKHKTLLSIIFIFVVAFCVMIPKMFTTYKSVHDTCFHVSNVIGYTDQLRKNPIVPSKIVGNMAHEFGYGTQLFYPPLGHTVISYVNLVSNNVLFSFKFVSLICLFLSGVTMYFLSKKISKNNIVGILSAVIYMLFPYHISDIYIRDAIGETFLFIFLPMILSGLYELYYGDKNKFYWLFTIGYVLGMLSHLTLMVHFTILIVVLLIVKYKETLKNLKHFLICSAFILLITSPFLVTLLEHLIKGSYGVFTEGHMHGFIWHLSLHLRDYVNVFNNYGSNEIKYFIDIVTLFLLAVTAVKYRKIEKTKFYNLIVIFAIISIVFSTKAIPWDILPESLKSIQFPWRYETFVALSVSLLAPICFMTSKKNTNVKAIICIVGIIAFMIPNLKPATENEINPSDFWNDGGMGWQEEYLPIKTFNSKDYFDNRSKDIIVKSGSCKIREVDDNLPEMAFKVDAEKTCTLEFPRLYYKGYTLKDEYNKEVELTEDEYGFLSAEMKQSGSYYLLYKGTKIEILANLFAIIGTVFFVGWRLYEKD